MTTVHVFYDSESINTIFILVGNDLNTEVKHGISSYCFYVLKTFYFTNHFEKKKTLVFLQFSITVSNNIHQK